MALFGPQIAGLYLGGRSASDLDVIVLAALFLKVGAAFQIFDALQVVGVMCLRGLKDTRVPMILAASAYWLIGTPTSLLLAFVFHMKGLGHLDRPCHRARGGGCPDVHAFRSAHPRSRDQIACVTAASAPLCEH